jgi:group I intron endonuclease
MRFKRIVYGLYDPRTSALRYIGKSESGESRLLRHLNPKTLNTEKTHKSNWIKSLIKLGLKPYLQVLYTASEFEDLSKLEISFIAKHKASGDNLTNQTNGGEGMLGFSPTEETRKKISSSKLGIFASAEVRAKMSISHSKELHHFYDSKLSDDHKLKISKGLLGNNLGKSMDLNFKNAIAKSRGSTPFKVIKNNVVVGLFISLREAEKSTGFNRKLIKKLLLNSTLTPTNGYIFKYE